MLAHAHIARSANLKSSYVRLPYENMKITCYTIFISKVEFNIIHTNLEIFGIK